VIAMPAVFALVCALQGAATAWERLAVGDLYGALELAEDVAEPLERARLESEIFYLGRRFERARSAAIGGLTLEPADPRLALRALQSSLWLRAPALASADLVRLAAAVAIGVEPEHRAAWGALVEQHARDVAALEDRADALVSAQGRARTLVVGLGALAALVLGFGLWGAYTPARDARKAVRAAG